jgi:hypothetical protein
MTHCGDACDGEWDAAIFQPLEHSGPHASEIVDTDNTNEQLPHLRNSFQGSTTVFPLSCLQFLSKGFQNSTMPGPWPDFEFPHLKVVQRRRCMKPVEVYIL